MTRPLLLAALLAACSGSTGGRLLKQSFQAGGSGRTTFTTTNGWTVTLTKARVALGPFYFNVSPPPTNAFRGGLVIMEATTQIVVDPLDATMHEVPDGLTGESGRAVSVEIGLLPPDSAQSTDNAQLLDGGVAYVEGTATKGADTVPFAGRAVIDQTLATPAAPLASIQRIPGAAVDLQFERNDQQVVLRVDPTHWFDQTDFTLLESSSEGPRTWTQQSTFHAQLLQGLKTSSGVYIFGFAP